MNAVVVVVAGSDARGNRVDQFLARASPEMSRARVQALIAAGQVRLDGALVKASFRLKGGEVLELTTPELVPAEPVAENLPLSIIYQDADIAVLDKAAGMVVHPGAGHSSGTLVNALLHHLKDLGGVGGELRPGIVHRLDKDTSGLLIVAKHDRALRALQLAFKSREVTKIYLALVAGQPPEEGTFRTLHGRHPRNRLRFTGKVQVGKSAITHFKVVQRFPSAALVEVRLETGRTHQIRMHFAEAGFPLLSDALYGNRHSMRADIIDRQALHAWRIAFTHPTSGQALHFTAPTPRDFREAKRRLALSSSERSTREG